MNSFTVPEVAEILKVSNQTVYKILARGELVGFKVTSDRGAGWKILERDLEFFILKRKKETKYEK